MPESEPFRADVVARMVQGWLGEDDESPPGRMVVVSGAPQSGRTTVLERVARDLAATGHAVVRRVVRDGIPQAPDDVAPDRLIQAAKIVGAATSLGSPVAGGLILLAAEIATGARMESDDAPAVNDAVVLVERVATALEQRAAAGPMALLIDDADQLVEPHLWWDVLFASLLPDLVGSRGGAASGRRSPDRALERGGRASLRTGDSRRGARTASPCGRGRPARRRAVERRTLDVVGPERRRRATAGRGCRTIRQNVEPPADGAALPAPG